MPYAAWRAILAVAKHGEIRWMLEQFSSQFRGTSVSLRLGEA